MRTSVTRAVAVVAAALAAGWPGDAVPRAQAPAELVLVNGKVITVDPADAVAQAVAISGGRIVGGGLDGRRQGADRSRHAGRRPGRPRGDPRPDRHPHPLHRGRSAVQHRPERPDHQGDEPTCVARVAAQVAKTKPGEWVTGDGWDEGKLAERRHITAADLDKVSPNNPVWLRQHHRALRRRQHLRDEDRRAPQGHARPAGRHHRPRRRRRARTAWCSRAPSS